MAETISYPSRQFSKTRPSGPQPATIMIIGEAPGGHEEVKGTPFVGPSGDELDKMLAEAGFLPQELLKLPAFDAGKQLRIKRDATIFLTNVCKYRPPENKIENFFLDKKRTKPNELIREGLAELLQEIEQVKPKLIIALGDTALWALTGNHGITKWRGSMLSYGGALLLPTYHPALILREWSWRSIAMHDLRRAKGALEKEGWPKRNNYFLLRPSFQDTMEVLHGLTEECNKASKPYRIASDLETRRSYIACHSIAWSANEAICIPSMCVERPTGYWTLDEDVAIWEAERELLTHPNVEVVGQNYLYDAQYFARRRGYVPRLRHDTMFMQHCAFAGLPKGLDFLSSMYAQFHVYWKDEGKEWNPKIPEDNFWSYGCTDGVVTYEVAGVMEGILHRQQLWDIYQFQMRLWAPILRMMLRGVRIDKLLKGKIASELIQAIMDRDQKLTYILGRQLNIGSPKQVHYLFYEELRCRRVIDRKTRRPTCDEDALTTFAQREPLLKPITTLIADLRSLGSMMSNIIQAPVDADGQMRSYFTPTAETYRWQSQKNSFGGGTNFQNWTKGDEDKEKEAIVGYPVPNVRKLIVPPPGYEIASIDLTGADAQTVAWESDDAELKHIFRENKIKIHAHNAKVMFKGKAVTGYEQPYYDLCRTGVHLINYVGGPDELAGSMGISRYEASEFSNYWFQLHPNILEWHQRIQDQLQRTRTVTNRFGYRRFYFDRIEGLLPKAVAWIGQSTTACVTNRAFIAMEEDKILTHDLNLSTLIQVHDELVFQYPAMYRNQVLSRLHPLVHITVPYDDPLVIPWGLKTSMKSWGDCEKREWPVVNATMLTG